MTALAQAHKVLLVMGSAHAQLDLVMNVLGGNGAASLLAAFAQRVGRDVLFADDAPSLTVSLTVGRVTPIAFVFSRVLLGMLRTETGACKLTAAGVSAGLLCFVWHLSSPTFRSIEKAPWDCSRKACVRSTLPS